MSINLDKLGRKPYHVIHRQLELHFKVFLGYHGYVMLCKLEQELSMKNTGQLLNNENIRWHVFINNRSVNWTKTYLDGISACHRYLTWSKHLVLFELIPCMIQGWASPNLF